MIQYLAALDLLLFQFIHGFVGRIRFLDWLAIFFAQYLGYLLILVFLILILREKIWQRRVYYFLFATLSVLFSRGLLTEIIRYIVYRPRPFLVLGITPLINHDEVAAFPSGHAAFYFALSFAIWYFNRKWGSRFLIASILIGIARVYAGVHWPLDLIGGILVAGLSFFIVRAILPKTKTQPPIALP